MTKKVIYSKRLKKGSSKCEKTAWISLEYISPTVSSKTKGSVVRRSASPHKPTKMVYSRSTERSSLLNERDHDLSDLVASNNNTLLPNVTRSYGSSPDLEHRIVGLPHRNEHSFNAHPSDSHDVRGTAKDKVIQKRIKYVAFCVLACAIMIEGADLTLFGASLQALQEDLGFTPFVLGILNSSSKVVGNVMGFVWGWHLISHSRKNLLIFGAFTWGLVSIIMAFTSNLPMWIILRIAHGISFGCMMPIGHSVLADITKEGERGIYYSMLAGAYQVGTFLAWQSLAWSRTGLNHFGTHVKGWQLSYFMIGGISILLAGFISCCFREPRRLTRPQKISLFGEIKSATNTLVSIPSFRWFILDGILYTGVSAMNFFFPMFLQYCYISDTIVASLTGFWSILAAVGAIIGGRISDRMNKRYPLLGRVWVAQGSILICILLHIITFAAVPRRASSAYIFLILYACKSIFGGWVFSAAKLPLISELTLPAKRASVNGLLAAVEH